MKRLALLTAILGFSSASFANHYDAYIGERVYLGECGGTMDINSSGSQVNLVFRGVENCSNFDILSSNGDSVDYPNKKLQGQNPDRYGSFTLPKSVQDYGRNTIQVVVKSNSGKTQDRIKVKFYRF